MVKVKNKKNNNLADKVRIKRKADTQKKILNPFEVHINREKFKVIGKKSKHDRGLPGVARAKAIQKRKETLGTEMKLMHKTNTFLDRRIGEKNSSLTGEDKINARFAAERAKQHSKKNIFNLADDEVLTHRGQTLEEIEKFDDPRSSDDEEDDGRKVGGLSNKFVAEGHFGGGILSKTDSRDGAKSHKDLIEQLIADSKKRKMEKQKLKEQTLDLTEKLDTDWKDLQPVVFKRAKNQDEEPSLIDKLLSKEENRGIDYDKMMRELRFEKRGTPSDGLKSEEAIAKETKEKLENLEKERLERMHGGVVKRNSKTTAVKHRSADDLDDNFDLDDGPQYMVAYDKDGKPLVPEHVLNENSLRDSKKQAKFYEGYSDTDDDENDDTKDDSDISSDDGESDDSEADSLNDLKESDAESNDEDKGDKNDTISNKDTKEVNSSKTPEKTIVKDDDKEINDDSSDDSDEDMISKNDEISKTLENPKKSVDKQANDSISNSKPKSVAIIQNGVKRKQLDSNEKPSKIPKTNDKTALKDDEASTENDSSSESDDDSAHSISHSKTNDRILLNTNISANLAAKSIEIHKAIDNDMETNDTTSQSDSNDNTKDVIITENVITKTEEPKLIKLVNQRDLIDNDAMIDDQSVDEKVLFDEKVVDERMADQIKADLLARKVVMEQARKELPYTYKMPEEYEELEELISKHQPEYQAVILERLIKCYHISLAEINKELLNRLFAFLLQYVNDLFSDLKTEKNIVKSFQIFDKIVPNLYDLAQMNIMNAKKCLTEVIIEKYEDFKTDQKKVPDLDTLIFFKLVSLLFPTSDFRHPVVTPCFVFMSEILTKCKFYNAYSISRGIFVTSIILEYTVLSKRFVPSAINFIRGILYMSAKTTILNPIQIVPPFKLFGQNAKVLVLENDCRQSNMAAKTNMEVDKMAPETNMAVAKMASETKMAAKDLTSNEIDDGFKVRSFNTAANMLKEMFTTCNDVETQECMFQPHIQLLSMVDLDTYPVEVAENVSEMVKYMKQTLEMKTYTPLAREKKKPRALKLYEPDVQDVFTGSKNSKQPREKIERDKLKHKYKKEMKGAIREIRRDKAYIGAVKIKQKIYSDNIRKEKVRQIYKDASIQQGELNQLKRQK